MMTYTGPAVWVSGLSVRRGGRDVLRDLSFSVRAGSVVGLLGPSGCGKTTLMRCLVGTQRTAAGRVEVLGLPAGSRALRERVAYMTQAPAVYADLTVRENLAYLAAVLGLPRARVGEVLAQVGLADRAGAVVGTLSGGQVSRVSLAGALLGGPDLLVLDEPTVGLDPVLRRELWGVFRSLADAGATLLVSSHVMDEAARCDRLLLLREGLLLADDTPAGLLAATGAADVEGAFLRLVEAPSQLSGKAVA